MRNIWNLEQMQGQEEGLPKYPTCTCSRDTTDETSSAGQGCRKRYTGGGLGRGYKADDARTERQKL